MRRLAQTTLLLLLLLSALRLPLHAATADPSVEHPATLHLTLSSTPLPLKVTTRAEGTFTSFETEEALLGEVGAPALPVVSELVAVPTLAPPSVAISLAASQTGPSVEHPIEPVPTYRPVFEAATADPTLFADYLEAVYLPDPTLYARDGWYPAEPVRISEPLHVRGQTMVRVAFTPVQVNLATGALRWLPAADITLAWDEAALASPNAVEPDPHFEAAFAASLANYDEARAWRTARPAPRRAPDDGGTDERWIVTLEGKGLFRIPLSDLQAAGVDVSDPARLALFAGSGEQEQEQAIWIHGGGLYLLNTRDHGRWSKQNIYTVRVLPTPTGLRMAELPAAPTQPVTMTATAHDLRVEEDQAYMSRNSTLVQPNVRNSERWIWQRLLVTAVVPTDSISVTFDLPHLVPGTDAVVTSELGPVDGPYPCNHLRVRVNHQSAERAWNNQNEPFGQPITVPAGDLSETGNEYSILSRDCGSVSLVAFNAFTVRYQRALVADGDEIAFANVGSEAGVNYQVAGLTTNDVVAFETTATGHPRRLTDGTLSGGPPYTFTFGRSPNPQEKYLVTTLAGAHVVEGITRYQDQGIRDDLSQTDYLIITPPEFRAAVEPLAAHRQAQGLTTRVVETPGIYNDFGDGTPDPQAIRRFIEYAYQNWEAPRLAYLLLVGDATYDPFNILGTGERVWLPPMMEYRDLYLGEVPSDNAFVAGLDPQDVPGSAGVAIPDIFIGRLPANSAQETAAMVQKIIRYEAAPPALDDWRRRFLFVAEDPDSAGDFHYLSEHLLSLIPDQDDPGGNLQVDRAYLRQPGGPFQSEVAVRDNIVFQMNQGLVLLQYIGHAGMSQWAGGGGVWSLRRSGGRSDLERLRPNDRLPMTLPWTCWEGYFVKPGEPAISESMIRLPDRGTIASFAPTGLDVATGHDIMAVGFFKALFHEQAPTTELGPLTTAAKLNLMAVSPGWSRLNYTYMLYGDPALNLNIDPCVYDEGVACQQDTNLFMPGIFH